MRLRGPEPAAVGAVLSGHDAELFFEGLCPANLSESNVTLAALRTRVASLRQAREVELCLKSCRPDPADASQHGVAYHVFGTRLRV